MKRVKVVKRRGKKEHLKQGDEQNKFIYYNNEIIVLLQVLKVALSLCINVIDT